MSATAADGPSHVQARQTLIPLLREYTESLNAQMVDARSIADRLVTAASFDECTYLVELLHGADLRIRDMESAVGNLSRRVSQLLEHGRFEHEDDQVELQLRLADLESTLRAALDTTNHAVQFAQAARQNAAQQK